MSISLTLSVVSLLELEARPIPVGDTLSLTIYAPPGWDRKGKQGDGQIASGIRSTLEPVAGFRMTRLAAPVEGEPE